MRVDKWHSVPMALVLLLGIAVAQKNSPGNDLAKSDTADKTELAKSVNEGKAAVQPSRRDGAVVNAADKPSDQSVTQSGARSSATPNPPPAPFIEDFPADAGEKVVRPRGALPTILNPDFPAFDRFARPEDIKSVPEDYVIGEEDVLTIAVWKERDLSNTVVVRPDGKITVPLVGELNVVGMKPAQLQSLLEDKLKPFVTVPQVSVSVNQINSRKIYLIGQVVREGTLPMNSSMTVLQVLAGAGGLRDFAKRKKIYILRKHGDQEIRFPFDYDAAIRGRNTEQNIRVEPGDTIVVP